MKSQYTDLAQQFINGIWSDGQDTDDRLQDINPYNGQLLAEIKGASQADVDLAYKSASAAQHDWENQPLSVRITLLEKAAELLVQRKEELIGWLVKEAGSTLLKANIEIDSARRIILEAATFPLRTEGLLLPSLVPGKQSYVYRRALGVIGVIGPWNFPFHLAMRSVAPALVLGNTVVLKPSSDTPITGGLLLAKIFEEAGLPKGVLNVIVGSGSVIGDYFATHTIPKLISFTGSTPVGKRIGEYTMSGKTIKRLALELGGNSPLIVLDDADLELAAHAAVFGRFLHSGQICMSTNRVIAVDSIFDRLTELILQYTKDLKYGDPSDPATAVGPIINAKQTQDVLQKIATAKKEGARALLEGPVEGNVIPPHIFVDVTTDNELFTKETFGPVLPIIRARDEQHALELANCTEHGLSSAVFTEDYQRGLRFARGLDVGMTHINGITVDDEPNAPFGGEKNSGLGRFNGQWVLEEFTRVQWITYNPQKASLPF